MFDAIYIVGNQMVLMDADGNTHDCCQLTSYRKAKRQVQRWAEMYVINVADAYRELESVFSQHLLNPTP